MKKIILTVFLFLFLLGCQPPDTTEFIECPAEKSNICTLQYDPVCGEDGKTYGNGCEACQKVSRYKEGKCT